MKLWMHEAPGTRLSPVAGVTIEAGRLCGAHFIMATKKKSAKLYRCPTCSMLVQLTDEDYPFCSDRCRKIDLGKWASGVYKISSPILDPEVLDDLAGLSGGRSKDSDEY